MKALVEGCLVQITVGYLSTSRNSSQVLQLLSNFTRLYGSSDACFSELAKLNVSEVNTSVRFAKISVPEKLILWSSQKLINSKISLVSEYLCVSSFETVDLRLGLQMCSVKR